MKALLRINQIRRLSQASLERLTSIPQERCIWKTSEDDPRKHDLSHEGLFYQLPEQKMIEKIYGDSSPFDLEVREYYKAIGVNRIMVRKPALTAINYIKKLKPSLPNVRMLFYGDKGHGKTHTLAHLLHYLYMSQNHVMINIREIKKFARSPWEFKESTSRPGRIDTPLNAAIFLQYFKNQNSELLDKLKDTLVCSQDYKWSSREFTKAGSPLVAIAEHGLNRVIHASDCMAVLFKELMLASDEGKIQLVSSIDNVNFLFDEFAGVLKHPDLKRVIIDEITVARAIKKLIKGKYKGGLVLATCDDKLSKQQNQTPGDVLGVEGWNCFDPFLPIPVPKYSRKEYESCMNMYQDIGWLCRPESRTQEVRDEIRFISGSNPKEVEYLCKAL